MGGALLQGEVLVAGGQGLAAAPPGERAVARARPGPDLDGRLGEHPPVLQELRPQADDVLAGADAAPAVGPEQGGAGGVEADVAVADAGGGQACGEPPGPVAPREGLGEGLDDVAVEEDVLGAGGGR